MLGVFRKKFTAKLMLLIGLILVMPAVTYLVAVLISSSSIKQFYVRIIDEYGRSEKEGETFVLEEETKRWIKRISIDVARQMDLFLAANRSLRADDLAKGHKFRELAVQPVGRNGYTLVADVTAGRIIAHPDSALEGRRLESLAENPGLAPIISKMVEAKFGEGEYLWPAGDRKTRKYLFASPVPTSTGDGHRLSVAATADMDEMTAPARRRSEGGAIKHILNIIEDRRTRDMLVYSLIASGVMGAILIVFSAILLRKGIVGLKELSDASARVATGNFELKVRKFSDDEFGELSDAFNRMATVLKETVISRNYYERAKMDAERANRMKSEFLANVSHEIRTPLNAIIGLSEILLDEEKSEERQRYLLNITKSGRRLSDLINNILELSRIESGKIALHIAPVDLELLARGLVEPYEHICKSKGLKLVLSVDPGVPETIDTDEARLRQVLVSLLDNAMKFTERGEISFSIEPYSGPRRGTVIFIVKDTGAGMPKEKQESIFAGFVGAGLDQPRVAEGTGLGLAISANLIGVLGGEIWLDSELGSGSTFSFTIS